MNPTALQILRAALENISRACDQQHSNVCNVHGACRTFCNAGVARAALEAAAKAPGLADDEELMTEVARLARQCPVGQARFTMEPVTSLLLQTAKWILDAVDAYQRGGK